MVSNPEIGIEISNYDVSCGRDVIIPNTIGGKKVFSIGKNAFYEKGITSVELPSHLTYIGFSSFDSNNLTSIEIPDGVTEISHYAFWGNNISDITLPKNLKFIGDYSFQSNDIKQLEIPNGTSYIGVYAFNENEIENLSLPNTVIGIFESAFNGNNIKGETAFIYNRKDDNHDGIAEIDTTTLIGYGGSGDVVIPEGVKVIRENTFMYCKINSVQFPSTLITIGYHSFSGNSLKSIEIPDSVTTIGDNAFTYNKLESVVIGRGIQYIGYSAFEKSSKRNTNLESITFEGKTCEEIKNIEASSWETTKYFPWLHYSWNSAKYYLEGYKAKVYGTDGECVY